MILRAATFADADFLWALRLDPQTVYASYGPPPTYPEHIAWLRKVLLDPARRLYIVEESGIRVGTARLDLDDGAAEVSLTVAPALRGFGIGRAILDCVENSARVSGTIRLIATIKPDNAASQRIFGLCGYAPVDGTRWEKPLG